jgi:CheY-like chemotaxis protein
LEENPMKILVIDDSRFQRSQLTRMLGQLGHEVIGAGNGQEGLVMLLQEGPDVVLCDLLMPVLDGFGFLAMVKAQAIPTPVIVASADVQNSTRELCFQLGARSFVTKPCSAEDLEAVLQPLGMLEGQP